MWITYTFILANIGPVAQLTQFRCSPIIPPAYSTGIHTHVDKGQFGNDIQVRIRIERFAYQKIY